MLVNLIFWIVRFVQQPGWDYGALIVLAVALFLMAFVARIFAIKNQDRIIRLEERLRYAEVLPDELKSRQDELSMDQIIALRFASDDELASLYKRALDGELTAQKEIKVEVKEWRADHQRV